MPVVSRYCNICNRLITSREIESGEAIVYQTYYYCPKCKEEAMPIIEAIRRRQEKDEEEEEQNTESKKSSTRIGKPPRYKTPTRGHKLHKTRSGIFDGQKASKSTHKSPPRRKPRTDAGLPHKEKQAGQPHKPSSDFDQVIKKASGRSSSVSEPEQIEIVDEPFDQEESALEEMSFEEVVSSAELAETDKSSDDKLAASGITFEDFSSEPVLQGNEAEAQATGDAKEPEDNGQVDKAFKPPVLEVAPSQDVPQAVILDVQPGDTEKAKPAASKKPGTKTHRAPTKVTRHIHPGKRHTHLQLPQKKKPWLFILIIILMVVLGGGLIVYKQFFMEPPKNPTEVKKEEEKKKQFEELEKELSLLTERSRKIAENPQDYNEFLKKAQELKMFSMPSELRTKLKDAEKNAEEKFHSAARMAFAEVKSGFDKALTDGDLQASLKSLHSFPDYFNNTEHVDEIEKLKKPVQATIDVLEQFKEKKLKAVELEGQGLFEEAVKVIEEISYDPSEVLTEYLKDIAKETQRLKELARKEKERIEAEDRKVRVEFENADKLAHDLADKEKFQEAIDVLKKYRNMYPGSKYESDILRFLEQIVDLQRRARIRNFFNEKDLAGWSSQGDWNVTDSQIRGAAKEDKIWLLKGDSSWSNYIFEFDFKRIEGSLVLCLRTDTGNPEAGFTLDFKERPFQVDTWYHVKCEAAGGNIFVTTSFNGQKFVFKTTRGKGVVGFMLPAGSKIHIRNVTMELP